MDSLIPSDSSTKTETPTAEPSAEALALTQHDIIKQAWASYRSAQAKARATADQMGEDDNWPDEYADASEGGFILYCYQVLGREAMTLNSIIAHRLRTVFGDAITVAECEWTNDDRVVPAFQFPMRDVSFGAAIAFFKQGLKPIITWHFSSYEDAPKFYIGTNNWDYAKAFHKKFWVTPTPNAEDMNAFDVKAMNY